MLINFLNFRVGFISYHGIIWHENLEQEIVHELVTAPPLIITQMRNTHFVKELLLVDFTIKILGFQE